MHFCYFRHAEIAAMFPNYHPHLSSPEAERNTKLSYERALLPCGLGSPNASDMQAPGLPPDRAPMFCPQVAARQLP